MLAQLRPQQLWHMPCCPAAAAALYITAAGKADPYSLSLAAQAHAQHGLDSQQLESIQWPVMCRIRPCPDRSTPIAHTPKTTSQNSSQHVSMTMATNMKRAVDMAL